MSDTPTPEIERAREIAVSLKGQPRASLMAMSVDKEMSWSATHGWPVVRDKLQCQGLIEQTNTAAWQPRTRLTPFGVTVREAIRAEMQS